MSYKWLVVWRLGNGFQRRRFTVDQKAAAWKVYYSKRRGRDCAIFRAEGGRWVRAAGFGVVSSN